MYNLHNYVGNWNWTNYQDAVVGGAVGAVLATLLIVLLFVLIALYVYFALASYSIAKKMKHKKPWLAWIPVANIAMWLQLGGFHWAWIFLLLVPIAGLVAVGFLFIMASWKVFEKLKYPGWLALSPLLGLIWGGLGTLAYGIILGIVAWKKK